MVRQARKLTNTGGGSPGQNLTLRKNTSCVSLPISLSNLTISALAILRLTVAFDDGVSARGQNEELRQLMLHFAINILIFSLINYDTHRAGRRFTFAAFRDALDLVLFSPLLSSSNCCIYCIYCVYSKLVEEISMIEGGFTGFALLLVVRETSSSEEESNSM